MKKVSCDMPQKKRTSVGTCGRTVRAGAGHQGPFQVVSKEGERGGGHEPLGAPQDQVSLLLGASDHRLVGREGGEGSNACRRMARAASGMSCLEEGKALKAE